MNRTGHAHAFDRCVTWCAAFLLPLIALALPWGLYQRIPTVDLTLTKAAGALLIPLAAIQWLRRPARLSRPGIEWPLAAFALVCVLSLAFSVDPAATRNQLTAYCTYLVFFAAMLVLVDSARTARNLLGLYLASSIAAAIYTLMCYGGWFWPTLWDTASWPAQRLLLEYRAGIPMRMTAASTDFNLAAIEVLVALAIALFAWPERNSRAAHRVRAAAVVLLGASLAIAMSRSGLLVAAGLVAAFLLRGRTRNQLAGAAAVLVGGAVLAALITYLAAPAFFEVLADRAGGGVLRDDGSVRGRLQVYAIAFALIPRYFFTGCGLGAVDAAMAQSPYSDAAVMTLHSMPLKFLLELGVLGFAAFIWLCAAIYLRSWRMLARSDQPDAQGTGQAFVALFTACLLMLAIQPFPMLSLYPFLLALAFGPIANRRAYSTLQPGQSSPGAVHIVPAALVVAAVAATNIAAFQRTAQAVERYTDAMAAGYQAGREARFDDARRQFALAANWAAGEQHGAGRQLERAPFFANASALFELPKLFEEIELPAARPPLTAAAQYAKGRVALAVGELTVAQELYTAAWTAEPRYHAAQFALAEAMWREGMFRAALELYRAWAERSATLRTDADAARLERVTKAASDGRTPLSRAAAMRRLGRWDEALTLYREIAAGETPPAEAVYNLGVDAELSGQPALARTHYQRALDRNPRHHAAHKRLAALP